jgi:hypothetical protein
MARLTRLAGRGRVLEILLGGEDVPVVLAERYGYVNRVHPEAERDELADRFARRAAAPGHGGRLRHQAASRHRLPARPGRAGNRAARLPCRRRAAAPGSPGRQEQDAMGHPVIYQGTGGARQQAGTAAAQQHACSGRPWATWRPRRRCSRLAPTSAATWPAASGSSRSCDPAGPLTSANPSLRARKENPGPWNLRPPGPPAGPPSYTEAKIPAQNTVRAPLSGSHHPR